MIAVVGRALIVAGLVLVVAGILSVSAIGFRSGLEDCRVTYDPRRNGAFYFPIVTSLLLSVLLTLVMWLFNRR